MKLSTVTKRESQSIARIKDVVGSARAFHLEWLTVCARVNDCIPATLPQHARRYLRGYADALLDQILYHETEFRYLIDGVWVNAHELNPSDYLTLAQTPRLDTVSASFWKGTERFFSADYATGCLIRTGQLAVSKRAE